jgi:hypothetical protein
MLKSYFTNGNPGNEVYATDPGSPDQFDQTAGGATSLVYDVTHALGLLAAKCSTGASGDQVGNVQWTTSFGTLTDHYSRFYVYMTGYPPTNSSLAGWMTSALGSGIKGRIRIDSDGLLRITNAAATVLATAGSALPLNQWVRLEWHVVHDVSVGSVELRVYSTDPQAAVGSYDYALSASGANTGVDATGIMFGWCLSSINLPAMWIDALAAAATGGWVGPSAVGGVYTEPARTVLPFTAWTAPLAGNATVPDIDNYHYLIEESADRLQFVSSPASPYGPLSLQITVHQNDTDHDGRTDRNEVAANAYTYAPGQDFWLAMAVYLDPTFPSVVSPYWQEIHQMFGSSGGTSTGSPPLAIEIDTNNFSLTVRGGVKANPGAAAPRQAFYQFTPATTGVWHEFLINAFLAKDASGSVDLYHRTHGSAWNSTPDASDRGVNVLTVAGQDQWVYPETGLYRATRPEIGIAYYGGVRIRSTRQDAESLWRSFIPGWGRGKVLT